MARKTGAGFKGGGLGGERLVEEVDREQTVVSREGGKPMLFDGITLVASETVDAFKINNLSAGFGAEGSQRSAEEGRYVRAAVFMHGIAGDQCAIEWTLISVLSYARPRSYLAP